MKKSIKLVSAIAGIVLIATAFKPTISKELEIGSAIPNPDYKMLNVDGKEVSLAEVKSENGLLVIFSCNTCPYVKLSESRIKEMASLAKSNKIGVIIVNSNEAQRTDVDSPEEMKKYASTHDYDFSYVIDKNSKLADAFGATRTPHIFLFDKKGLAYRGAIDDNVRDAKEAKEHFLKDALLAVGKGQSVKTNSTKSVGCGIKRLD